MAKQWLPVEQYVAGLPKAAVYGCLFFTDTAGRPLQLLSSVHGGWQWPGGDMDPGESPWETAVRECREETGLVFTGPPRLLATEFMPVGQWPVTKVGFVFDGGELTDEELARITLDPEEHSSFEVRTMDEWAQVLDTRAWERLAAVNRARRTGCPVYREMRRDVCADHRPGPAA
ncbi:NUDIX domain-containing protein [Streptomyces sp. UNOC14_S4]|uniref:NUDIX domain-containing protein n=1 Tax=Streptomyces sp. UNOC14_S4 TaxID=2872340 RepID=UPI001E38B44F|nr:NUDIX hydrolase [Streptomyces sp. UNOC14_S4]MCC3769654.1 NUDIX hydrolase [Streptomyces sp. UNOC14_S4]